MPRQVIAGRRVGDLETEILQHLWEVPEPVTGRELLERIGRPSLAYTTLMTVLGRLVAKGLAQRVADRRVVRYRAAGDLDELTAKAIGELLAAARDRQAVLAYLVEDTGDPGLAAELAAVLRRAGQR
jgi:predicted transcriptional regulator